MATEPDRIRILCVNDHPVVRQGIVGLVGIQPDMSLVAEAANGREAIEQFGAHHPDVTLMDLQNQEPTTPCGVGSAAPLRGRHLSAVGHTCNGKSGTCLGHCCPSN